MNDQTPFQEPYRSEGLCGALSEHKDYCCGDVADHEGPHDWEVELDVLR